MPNQASAAGPASRSNEAPAALIRDFLEWLSAGPRPYAEVIEAWRTSCPRLTVWEDALDAGLIIRRGGAVALTDQGRERLAGRS
jgi:hypothetical protein